MGKENKETNVENTQEATAKQDVASTVSVDKFVLELISSMDLIKRGVESADQRLIGRALRLCSLSRSNLKRKYMLEVLSGLEKMIMTQEPEESNILMLKSLRLNLDLEFLMCENDVEMKDEPENVESENKKTINMIEKMDWNSMKPCLKECITLLGLLVLIRMYSVRAENYIEKKEKSLELKRSNFRECLEFSKILFEYCKRSTSQTMDQIVSKVIYFYSRIHEICGEFTNIKNEILECYRNAVLNHNSMTQAACINLILRNYVLTKRYDLGLKALEKMVYPENLSSGIQQARYLYYSGRIYSAQLEYQMAFNSFTQSLRKTPQTKGRGSLNFALSAQKFAIVVQMLMGEIPDRSIFNSTDLRKGLAPYFELVKAVRSGDMKEFDLNLQKQGQIYERDGTLSLIKRLAHNVIRSGLKTICSSYNRIYLDDIAEHFGWDNSHDVEGVVSKAIFDKVVDAKINDNIKCVESQQKCETYGSESMLNNLHSRIAFSLLLRSNAIKAMEYPQNMPVNKENNDDEEARRLSQEEIEAAVNSVDDGLL
ncbi:26s proteasomal subunit S3 PINT domain containing protein [Cryptosporidium ubiquitum]|uniref:26s proteasomal subunit S3 PINT domain containing protein n=1 Tax=Cryptosporidium ubiquitum TaxID=857276 RepID=A0A1J4MEU1_9CRYT|nr:26s proteasomal subunit S3 PINT domain containing protein [Cryptosporidium ubiquitum]OII72762.1 26s proteasomal subunit S3 PINT domain containing protein [Cryptosporidium ubiquitum]